MKKSRTQKGFTLAELLVVVAIIAVLVAVSIPIFTSQMEKSRAAVCSANKRSLKAVICTQYMSGELNDTDITKDKISLNSQNNYTYNNQTFTCPDGGTIYAQINNLAIEVRCTYHDDEHPVKTELQPWTSDTAAKIWTTLSSLFTGTHDADSFGSGAAGTTISINNALSKQGITLTDLGATSWHFQSNPSNSYFMWTSADISTMNPGEKVTAIKYNLSGDYPELYSVWTVPVQSYTNKDGKTYNIISTSGAVQTDLSKKLNDLDKQDISKVIDVYNQYADVKLKK